MLDVMNSGHVHYTAGMRYAITVAYFTQARDSIGDGCKASFCLAA